jgi:PKD repeat protein
VRLTVTDDFGVTGTTSLAVTVLSAPPTASFTFLPPTPDVNQTVTFDASASEVAPSSGRTIVSYAWNFGDGTIGTGQRTTHAYSVANTYTVILTVTDSAGQTNTATRTVPVASGASGPVATFVFTPDSPQTLPPGGRTFTFDASASRAGSNATIIRYQWQFLGRPNTDGFCAAPVLPGGPGAPAGPIVTTTNPRQDNTYTSTGTYCVFLNIFDNNGGSAQAIRLLTIQ